MVGVSGRAAFRTNNGAGGPRGGQRGGSLQVAPAPNPLASSSRALSRTGARCASRRPDQDRRGRPQLRTDPAFFTRVVAGEHSDGGAGALKVRLSLLAAVVVLAGGGLIVPGPAGAATPPAKAPAMASAKASAPA